MIGLAVTLISLILAFISVPLAIVIGIMALLLIHFFTQVPLFVVTKSMFRAVDTTVLMAIPLFILAGNLMTSGETARRLINTIRALVEHFSGGLAITGIVACVFFAAISGSSLACVAAIGAVMIPAMIRAGYDEKFTLGLITCAGSLGIMIPPSIPMILYGGMMDVSVIRLFMAGFGPGLFLAAALVIYTAILSRRRRWKGGQFKVSVLLGALKEGLWVIALPPLVLGGIYSGAFTPTEASAVCVVYVLFIEVVIYRDLSFTKVIEIVRDSAVFSGSLLFILCNSTALSWFLASAQIPEQLASFVLEFVDSKWAFLVLINILLLIVGCFLDVITTMIILLPLLQPLLTKFEVDFIHFGIIFILNLEIGLLTPPMGPNLFVAAGVAERPFTLVTRSIMPYLVIMILCLLAVTYLPSISLWLPGMLFD